eukprot:GHVN01005983.1.p1 GENE.GHVN01005983.1~~GHVN01005983.1.p1  ORF type:complete len:341 (+),score=68.86 GHVN01005983.1:85-1107(+)
MRVTHSGLGSNKVYDLSATHSLPQFVDQAVRRRQRRTPNSKRVELINDFEFKVAANKVRLSPDGNYIGAIGIYPGTVKVYETSHLSVKFSRGLEAEPVDMLFLSEDYRKFVLLLDDRHVEFHSQGGRHHRMRVPHFCRSLCYNEDTAMLYMCGSSNQIYRLDLELGAFESPFLAPNTTDVSSLSLSPSLPLLVTGGDSGCVHAWDLRVGGGGQQRSEPVSEVKVVRDSDDSTNGRRVTCTAFSPNGLHLAVGTSAGIVRVFDVRTNMPFAERDHMYDLPVKEIQCSPCSPGAGSGGVARGERVNENESDEDPTHFTHPTYLTHPTDLTQSTLLKTGHTDR